jgi:hypothetical protein
MNYQGHCHCGRIRFAFTSPEIVSAARCNCSLCVRRGALLSPGYIPAEHFTPPDNQDDLGIYLWNEHVLNNYFCKLCGVFTYIGDGPNNQDGYRVNLGCVDGIDPLSLQIRAIDGKSIPVVQQNRPSCAGADSIEGGLD